MGKDLEGGAGLRVLLIADAFGEERVGLHAERAAHPPHERQLGVDDVDPAEVAVANDRLELSTAIAARGRSPSGSFGGASVASSATPFSRSRRHR